MPRYCLMLGLVLSAAAANAEDSALLGYGRLFTNDYLGDGKDRWQSGSYVFSVVAGEYQGGAQPFGFVREYRFRSALITSDGKGAAPGDRPYAGTMSFGLHSHFGAGMTRSRLGFDMTFIGPSTSLSELQATVHDAFGMSRVRFTDQQMGNDTHLALSVEMAELFSVSPAATLRSFSEVQIGPEDLVRVGADAFLGGDLGDDLLIRDVATGQLYTGTFGAQQRGATFVFGADRAMVADSIYLPGGGAAAARSHRDRARVGVHWHGPSANSVFYGLTYIGPEYIGQSEGQVTGSVKLNFNF